MHTRFSNKIPKYSQVSLLPLESQKSPAEQLFVGGVFVLSACYVGKAADLLHCLRVSALFALRFFCLRTSPPALSPAWSPISVSGRRRLVRSVRIFRCNPAWLHALAWPAHTSGVRLSLPVIHAPALGIPALEASALHCLAFVSEASTLHRLASALIASAASTLYRGASALEASAASTLHCGASAASTLHRWASALEAFSASTLHCHASALYRHASALEALTESARASAPDVLIRTLSERAIWAWYPGIARLCQLEVCAHSGSAGHPASQSLPAAAAAAARTGKRLSGQNRNCQQNNDRCFDSCFFHFRFLSLMFHSTAFLSPILGSFYRDSGAGGKKVTPGENFSGKIFVLLIENGRLRKYQPVPVAIYFTSMFRLSCKSGIKTKKNLQTG